MFRSFPCAPAPGPVPGWVGLVVASLVMATGCQTGSTQAGLEITVEPEAARVFVEGEFKGLGKAVLPGLPAPGEYFVKADPPPGYAGRSEKVALRPGETRKLAWKLDTVAEARLRAEREAAAPAGARAGGSLPRVGIETSMGRFVVELFEDEAPNTVANFVALAERGYYDGTLFHRVIDGFMIQGGDPLSKDRDPGNDGTGGPGYEFGDEFSPRRRHDAAGVLSMANAGPGTNGSQFFVTLGPTHHLDDRHSVFGKVVEGMEVVRAIGKTPVGPNDRPRQTVAIVKAEVLSKRDHEYHPKGPDGRPLKLP